jgi:Protein of unknown function (DUF3168)
MDFFALQTALYNRLKASAELAAVCTGVFDYVPDQQAYPYVVFDALTGSREPTVDLSTRVIIEQIIRCYSNDADSTKGRKQVCDIATQVYGLFDAVWFFSGQTRLQTFISRVNILSGEGTLRTGLLTVQILFAT